MNRTKAKQILENLKDNKENFNELTNSILEFCLENQNTESYLNLITRITEFEDTKYIITKVKIIDVAEIIPLDEISLYKDFLQEYYVNLYSEIFDVTRMKYLVKFTGEKVTWYEVLYETQKSVLSGRIVLQGEVGKIGDYDVYAYGIIVDPFVDTIQRISDNNDKIIDIKVENNRKRYYVERR